MFDMYHASVRLAILDTQIKYKNQFYEVYGINNRFPLFMYLWM